MNLKNIKLIFLREVRDQLRDRRTLFMIAVLPLLLYPALGLGTVQLALVSREQTRRVVIIGADDLPQFCEDCGAGEAKSKIPELLNGDRFRKQYFREPKNVSKLRVITDRAVRETPDVVPQEVLPFIDASKELRQLAAKRKAIESPDDPRYEELNRRISRLMAEAKVQVLIIVPQGYAKNVETINQRLAAGVRTSAELPAYPGLLLLRNSADEKSRLAATRTRRVLDNWKAEVSQERWTRADLPPHIADPIGLTYLEVAEKSQISANLWSKLFPAILVTMALTGAFYPAVDLAAGEKERGTMETLLICPAGRSDVVVGKFLTIMAFSISTALLNLLSMGLTMTFVGTGATQISGLSMPSAGAVTWVILLLIPLAALFSAASLALATFAKSSKEGQYYLTPLLLVTMGLTFFCLSPTVQIDPFYSVIPIVGPTLLLKELLSSTGFSNALLYAIPVLAASIGYSALALWWAIEQFSREDILFREAERFNPRLWWKHLLRDKEPTPTFSEAVFCLVLMLMLMFGMMAFARGANFGGGPTAMLQMLMIQQLAVFATPAIIMGVMLTSKPRSTFKLYWPKFRYLAIACVLPFALHPLSIELGAALSGWFFPPLPESVSSQFGVMSASNIPVWLIVLAFAVTPAICEEIAFRGFLLSGFNHKGRNWLAIVLSAAAFGLIHMIPQQVFNAALLGLVIGLIAVRSNSLLPGIVFHFIYNSLGVANSRVGGQANEWTLTELGRWFFAFQDGGVRFEWPLLLICGAVAFAMLYRLVREGRAESTFEQRFGVADADKLSDAPAAAKP